MRAADIGVSFLKPASSCLVLTACLVGPASGCGSPTASTGSGVPAPVALASPSPVPTPTPEPSPSPAARGPSDVDSIVILNYLKCAAGRPFVITPGCRDLHTTMTPKRADGSDARQHGREVVWRVNGVVVPDTALGQDVGCVTVTAGPEDFTFNRVFYRIGPGCLAAVEVTLVDPAGRLHRTDRTIVVE